MPMAPSYGHGGNCSLHNAAMARVNSRKRLTLEPQADTLPSPAHARHCSTFGLDTASNE